MYIAGLVIRKQIVPDRLYYQLYGKQKASARSMTVYQLLGDFLIFIQ